jgi:hypothetical protein
MDAPTDDDLTPEDVAAYRRLPLEVRLDLRAAYFAANALASIGECNFATAALHVKALAAYASASAAVASLKAQCAAHPSTLSSAIVDHVESAGAEV